MIISIYDKDTLATFRVELPPTTTNIKNLVIVDEQNNSYELTSTVPDEVLKKNKLREEFESKEFDKLYQNFPNILEFNKDPEMAEKLVLMIMMTIKTDYAELEKMPNLEGIARTIASHFVPYASSRAREKQMKDANDKLKQDSNYCKDFALRILAMFSELDISNPNSVRGFSEKLSSIKKFMDIDPRRHAGQVRLLRGIAETVNKLSQVFLTEEGESKIDLVKAFTDIQKNNEELLKVKGKFNTIMKETKQYFTDVINDIDQNKKLAEVYPDDADIAYLALQRGLIGQYLNATNAYAEAMNDTTKDEATKKQISQEYGKAIGSFYRYMEDLVACYDAYTDNRPADNEHAKTIGIILDTMLAVEDDEKDPAWPYHLAVMLQSQAEAWFKDVPLDLRKKDDKTDATDQVQKQ